MTEILIQTDLTTDTKLLKLGASYYFDREKKVIYRLSFIPNGAVFYNQEIITPRLVTLNPCNPYFLAINQLLKKTTRVDSVPEHLIHLDLTKIANVE